MGFGFNFFGGVRVGVRGSRGVTVRALVISKVMGIRARDGRPGQYYRVTPVFEKLDEFKFRII